MSKIDEVKEILNTLRVWLSLIFGTVVVLTGTIFNKLENLELGTVFWISIIVDAVLIFGLMMITKNISKKTREIKDL